MRSRRSSLQLVARLAVVALILAAVPPAGAHRHATPSGVDEHADFCSTSGVHKSGPAVPVPGHHGQQACSHCDGCTGHAGNGGALPPTFAPPIALPATPAAPIAFATPAPTPVEQIAAPPRGPPHLA